MAKAQTVRRIPDILKRYETELLSDWRKELRESTNVSTGKTSEKDLSAQTAEFLSLLVQCAQNGDEKPIGAVEWEPLHKFLTNLSETRAQQGATSEQTASFIFSFKKSLFARLREEFASDPATLANLTWKATDLVDNVGLATIGIYQKTREQVIARQQEEMLELSTPVVKLWDGVLALPMIGTLDSTRTQVVMESLLQRIVETGSEIAIIDITGVPTVDTLVAQHLLKTVTAIRLMGADCIISGIRPQIAQTIVHLGVELGDVTTKASLADALILAMKRLGFVITKSKV